MSYVRSPRWPAAWGHRMCNSAYLSVFYEGSFRKVNRLSFFVCWRAAVGWLVECLKGRLFLCGLVVGLLAYQSISLRSKQREDREMVG